MKKSKPYTSARSMSTVNKKRQFQMNFQKPQNTFIRRTPQYSVSPYRVLAGLPAFMDTKLCYSEIITMDPNIGTYTSYSFAANDCFDPNVTGGGHQPLNYDQFTALYNKWCVTSSNILVRPISSGSPSAANPQWIGVFCTANATTLPTNELAYLEFLRITPNCSPAALVGGTVDDSTDAYRFKRVGANYVATRDNAKKTIAEIGETFCGTVSVGPQDLWYYIVQAWSVNGADAAAQKYAVEITYNVRFWEPIQKTVS